MRFIMFHRCSDTGTRESFEGMGFHINLCLTALYNKETEQYEITKDQLFCLFIIDRKNTRLNSSNITISYDVF